MRLESEFTANGLFRHPRHRTGVPVHTDAVLKNAFSEPDIKLVDMNDEPPCAGTTRRAARPQFYRNLDPPSRANQQPAIHKYGLRVMCSMFAPLSFLRRV